MDVLDDDTLMAYLGLQSKERAIVWKAAEEQDLDPRQLIGDLVRTALALPPTS